MRGGKILALTLGWRLVVAPFASAEELRLPRAGGPAIAVDVPEHWTSRYDELGNLQITAEDKSCALQLSIVTAPEPDKPALSVIAAGIVTGSGAAPYSRTEPTVVGGVASDAYVSMMTLPGGTVLDERVVVIKLDHVHYAVAATLAVPNLTPVQTANLNVLVSRIRLIRE